MKSKNPKIQIFKKGIATFMSAMLLTSPLVYATTSLDDSYLESSWWEQILHGTIGSTVHEIDKYLSENPHATLYITNETQLRAFAEYVNSGNDCSGKQIVLLNDIELNRNEEWVPIGNEGNRFKGIFDGRGFKISGINFNRKNKNYSELTNIGLFGTVEGTVQNVTISNTCFDLSFDLEKDVSEVGEEVEYKYKNLGAIAGYLKGGTIDNCNIEDGVTIVGLHSVGGIVGYNHSGKIINCSNEATIESFNFVGGIAGTTISKSNVITIDEECMNNRYTAV